MNLITQLKRRLRRPSTYINLETGREEEPPQFNGANLR